LIGQDWLSSCSDQEIMNAFFLLVVVAIIGFAFWFQKLSVSAHDADNRAAIELAEKSGTSPQPSAASNGQSAAHSYMKGALDRARDVRDQGRARTQAAQDPDSEK
jgi:hypothetical protein